MSQKASLFPELVDKYMPYSGESKETLNDEKSVPKSYHKQMLVEEYTADLTWASKSFNNVRVKADIVALDSPLPIKRRPSMGGAVGTIVKSGMKKWLGEKEISDIQIMSARGVDEAEIARKLFSDLIACRDGIDESNEYNFLKALSGGTILIPDEENPGVGVRIEFDFPTSNLFGVVKKWSDSTADTISDIERVVAKIDEDGNSVVKSYIGKSAYQNLRSSYGARRLHASSNNIIVPVVEGVPDYSGVPLPNRIQFNEEFAAEFGFELEVVDRTVRTEVNGKQVNEKPFDPNAMVFVYDDIVGRLIYGTLAEETSPVTGVVYNKAGSFTLLSKYSMNDPLREFSSSQALVLPILDNVEQIYILNTETVQA